MNKMLPIWWFCKLHINGRQLNWPIFSVCWCACSIARIDCKTGPDRTNAITDTRVLKETPRKAARWPENIVPIIPFVGSITIAWSICLRQRHFITSNLNLSGAAILVCSLPIKNIQELVHGVMHTFATCAGLVYDEKHSFECIASFEINSLFRKECSCGSPYRPHKMWDITGTNKHCQCFIYLKCYLHIHL